MDFTIGNGKSITVLEEGDINIFQGKNGKVLRLNKVGYFPDLPFKLISGGRLFQAGFSIEHGNETGKMDICKDGYKVLKACIKDNVLIIEDMRIVTKVDGSNSKACITSNFQGKGSSKFTNSKTEQFFPKKPDGVTYSPELQKVQDSIPAQNFLELKILAGQKSLLNIVDVDAVDVKDADFSIAANLGDEADGEATILEPDKPTITKAVQGVSELTAEEVHLRFGHVNIKTVCKILGLPPPDKDTPKIECESCELEKQRKQSLPDKAQSRASRPMYRLHIDSSGKKEASEGGNHYFVVVVDDNSRKGWTLLTSSKSEIPDKISTLLKQLQAQHPARKIAFIRLDGAKEYTQEAFKNTISDMGCSFEISAPYRQAQNGVAEARIGLTWKMAMSFLSHSSPDHPRSDWGYAVKHAGSIINIIPSDSNGGLSPDEVWGDSRSKLAVPGPLFCLCFAKVYVRGKMEPEAQKCVYMGNSEEHKAYFVRPLNGGSSSVLTSRDVTFFPSQMPYRHPTVQRPIRVADKEPAEDGDKDDQDAKDQEPDEDSDEEPIQAKGIPMEPQGEPVPKIDVPRGYSQGSKVYVVDQHEKTKEWRVYQAVVDSVRQDGVWLKFKGRSEVYGGYTPDYDVFRTKSAAEKELSDQQKANPVVNKNSLLSAMSQKDKEKISSLLESDPESRKDMLAHPHRDGYVDAELVEMAQLAEQKVWTLVKRERGMNVLGSRWVYKAKRDPSSGEITKFRSRLVAKGFKERYGKEFWETFSSNVKLEDVRLMIAIATYYDFDLWHFDIKAYFLYGIMDEVVHMSQPEGYHEGPPPGDHEEMVCLLKKAIYGTKQAQRCADKELKKALKELGIVSTSSDDSLYYAREEDKIFLCAMYVDDC